MKKIKKAISTKMTFSLRSILIFFCSTLIILLVGFISLYFNYFFSESMTRKIAESRLDVLTQVSDKILNIREGAEANYDIYWYNCFVNMDYAEEESDIIERFQEISEVFSTTSSTSDVKYEYVIVLDTGFSYATNLQHDAYDFDQYKAELWYLELLENSNEAIWVSTYEDYATEDDFVVSLVRALTDDEGQIKGLFLLNISEDSFYETYSNILDDNEIYIIDEDGKIFSHSNKEMLGIPFYDMERFNDMFAGEEEGEYLDYQIISKNGEEVLFSKLSESEQGWSFVEEISLSIVLADVTQLTNTLWAGAIISVIIAILLIIWISHYTTKPLKQLITQLEMVGQDSGDATTFNVHGWEEVNKICEECNFMDQRIRKLIYEVQQSEREKSKVELGFLQAQMSPHFMYNTLFSIKCLVEMGDQQGAVDTLNAFTAILRYILSYKTDYTTVSEEIALLEEYVKLQKVLYGERFSMIINCEPDTYDKKMLRMIVQPLLENSLQHGIAGDKTQVLVEISFQNKEGNLCIEVKDDGVGFNNYNLERLYKKVDKVEGQDIQKETSNLIGLNNIRHRIKKRYGEEYGIFIDSEYEDGAKITVKLPIDVKDY